MVGGLRPRSNAARARKDLQMAGGGCGVCTMSAGARRCPLRITEASVQPVELRAVKQKRPALTGKPLYETSRQPQPQQQLQRRWQYRCCAVRLQRYARGSNRPSRRRLEVDAAQPSRVLLVNS